MNFKRTFIWVADKFFTFVWKATHQFFDFSRIIGMRDRLRCPSCGAVGTWKPHGGWLDYKDTASKRRWLCKWCGFYRGWFDDVACPNIDFCEIDMLRTVWVHSNKPRKHLFTPRNMCNGLCSTPSGVKVYDVNPWRG